MRQGGPGNETGKAGNETGKAGNETGRLGMRHEWKQGRYAGNKVRIYFLSFLITFVTQPLAS